ncbi:Putative polypeptide N-acetylgalactosaminyltransferase-like protein 3 [Fukomys damarensis]|uniref:Putative polypeptide N-acetylgalactosaminyltransferase-like protein 3 n=1 Tax=Fukomys damarensis TaxID=885580 RepID=A0A091DPF3_FUKDA|nr:Putative polypeptide N-acetylgalactosaminyltransferase-like protein 3 [Fukomys damarensis]
MASLRRVKVLLVLNLIAVAGFVLFLAKCRPIAVRSGDAFHEIRPRAEAANLSAHSASPIQDAVLKRLSLLEDIVYRQLNGALVSGMKPPGCAVIRSLTIAANDKKQGIQASPRWGRCP